MTDTATSADTAVFRSADGAELAMPIIPTTEGPAGADVSQLLSKTGLVTHDPGFANTASCTSAITYIDGDIGILRYRGYPIEELARGSSFLEVSYPVSYT